MALKPNHNRDNDGLRWRQESEWYKVGSSNVWTWSSYSHIHKCESNKDLLEFYYSKYKTPLKSINKWLSKFFELV